MKRGILWVALVGVCAGAALVGMACSSSDSSSPPSDAGADRAPPPQPPPPPTDDSGPPGTTFRFTVTDVNGIGLASLEACIVDHPEIACATTGSTGAVQLQGIPSDNFTLGLINSQGKSSYAIDGKKLATLLMKPGLLVRLVHVPLATLDAGALDPAKGGVVIGQASISLAPAPRQFVATLTPAGGTEIDDAKFVAFANVPPGPVTIQIAAMTADAGADAGDAGPSVSCDNGNGVSPFAWDTSTDPSKASGRVYAGYTLSFAVECM